MVEGIARRELTADRIDEAVRTAVAGASPVEVMPVDDPAQEWTEDGARAYADFLRGRLALSSGALSSGALSSGVTVETSWLVDVDGAAAGVARLATRGGGVVEVGLWLARGVRGRGVGSTVLAELRDVAHATGARSLTADTTAGNRAAVAALRRAGAHLDLDGDEVRAELDLSTSLFSGPARSATLSMSTTSPGGNHMTDTATTTLNNIGVVMFAVADQDAALAFYTGKLGFEVRGDSAFGEHGEYRWLEVAPPGSVTRLALNPPMGGAPGGGSVGVESTDVLAEHAHLSAVGGIDLDPEPMRAPGVPLLFMLRDPDGNVVVVVEAPPAS